MPYIKQEDRRRFADLVNHTVNQITVGNEPLLQQGEFFGFWVNRLVKNYMSDPEYTGSTFNSLFFNEEKRKHLANNADKLAVMLPRTDPLEAAGNLNYLISSVYWGVLGSSRGVDEARYGHRAYLRGLLAKVRDSVTAASTGNQRDMTMAFRRHLVVIGVLDDVVDEAYRRCTVPYEDDKIAANGDLWEDGQLFVQSEQALITQEPATE